MKERSNKLQTILLSLNDSSTYNMHHKMHICFRIILHQYAICVNRWLIFALCVMVVFLEIGMASQFGAFYVKLLDKFQSSRAKTAAVQSTLLGVKLGLGKLITALLLVKCIAVLKASIYSKYI